jgi:hypothetical protein
MLIFWKYWRKGLFFSRMLRNRLLKRKKRQSFSRFFMKTVKMLVQLSFFKKMSTKNFLYFYFFLCFQLLEIVSSIFPLLLKTCKALATSMVFISIKTYCDENMSKIFWIWICLLLSHYGYKFKYTNNTFLKSQVRWNNFLREFFLTLENNLKFKKINKHIL